MIYPISTHYRRCIWGWLLKVPSQGFPTIFPMTCWFHPVIFPENSRENPWVFGCFSVPSTWGPRRESIWWEKAEMRVLEYPGIWGGLRFMLLIVFFLILFLFLNVFLLFLFCFFLVWCFYLKLDKKKLDISSHRVYTGQILVGFLKAAPFMWVLVESTTRMLQGFHRKPVQLNEKRFTGILLLAVFLPFCRGHQISNNIQTMLRCNFFSRISLVFVSALFGLVSFIIFPGVTFCQSLLEPKRSQECGRLRLKSENGRKMSKGVRTNCASDLPEKVSHRAWW